MFLLLIASNALATSQTPLAQQCVNVQNMLQKVLPAELVKDSDLECSLTAKGNGELFEKKHKDFAAWRDLIKQTLRSHGWRDTAATRALAADGPYSTQFALSKKGLITVVNFKVSADASKCPQDQPLDLYADCIPLPSDRFYMLEIKIRKH